MTTVITSVLIVTIIGIIAGVGLSVASVIMKVPVDEKQQKIREALPVQTAVPADFRAVTDMPPP